MAQYHLHNNPLFIPEIKLTENDGVRAFYIFAEHDAIGISPFSIEDGSDAPDNMLVAGYRHLNELMPLLTRYQGKGAMKGLLFDQQNKERILEIDDLVLTCRHNFTLPWDPRATDGSIWPEGGGIILRLNKNEYIIAGNGIVVEFAKKSEKAMEVSKKALGEDGFAQAGSNKTSATKAKQWKGNRCGIGSVDEVKINRDGSFSFIRRLNGDQDHQGRHVRISVGDYKTLHVKLYEYK